MMNTTELPELDRFILRCLMDTTRQVQAAFAACDTALVCKLLSEFTEKDLLGFYLDVRHRSLFFAVRTAATVHQDAVWRCLMKPCHQERHNLERLAVQTTLWTVLNVLVRLWAPVLSFFAEELWQRMRQKLDPAAHVATPHSVHQLNFADQISETLLSDVDRWKSMIRLRKLVMGAVETECAMMKKRAQQLTAGEASKKGKDAVKNGQDSRMPETVFSVSVDVTLLLPSCPKEPPQKGSGEADCAAIHSLLCDLDAGLATDMTISEANRCFLADFFSVQASLSFATTMESGTPATPNKKPSRAKANSKPKERKKGTAPLKDLTVIKVQCAKSHQ